MVLRLYSRLVRTLVLLKELERYLDVLWLVYLSVSCLHAHMLVSVWLSGWLARAFYQENLN
jgi:hypothetical protein